MKYSKIAYISGPITGIKNGNVENFARASVTLARCGYYTINPHDVCFLIPSGSPWTVYMRECIRAMVDANTIYMLRGWMFSRGSRVELFVAVALGMKVVFEKR